MAVGFESVVSAENNGGSSLSTGVIAPAGVDRYLLCGVTLLGGDTVTSVQKNSVAFTQIAVITNMEARIELFELKNPTTASETIDVVIGSGGDGFVVGCAAFSGVNQTTPIQTNETATGLGDPTRTITSAVGNFGMMVFSLARSLNFSATAGTERWDFNGDVPSGGGITEPGAASVQMTANYPQNREWALVAVSIAATVGIEQAIVLAGETDTTFAITWAKSKAVGVALETDSAQGVGLIQLDTDEKRRSASGIWIPLIPGVTPNDAKDAEWRWQSGWSFSGVTPADELDLIVVALETDSALTLAWAKSKAIGIAPETDTALALQADRLEVIGVAAETDFAFTLAHAKSKAVGIAAETDFAFVLGADRLEVIGTAGETDSAFVVGADRLEVIGIALETDFAFALTHAKSKGVGIAGETDSAIALGADRLEPIGVAGETDTALAIVGISSKVFLIGVAPETDSPFVLTHAKAKGIGAAAETDVALVVRPDRLEVIGLASETDTALALLHSKGKLIGIAPELDEVFALPHTKSKAVGIALEADSAFVLTRDKARLLGLGLETDSAFVLSHSKQKLIGVGTETDSAFLVVTGRLVTIALAAETDVPLAITHAKALLLGIAPETDTAFVLTADISAGAADDSWIIQTYRRRRR